MTKRLTDTWQLIVRLAPKIGVTESALRKWRLRGHVAAFAHLDLLVQAEAEGVLLSPRALREPDKYLPNGHPIP